MKRIRRAAPRPDRERGSMSVEMIVLVPVLLMVVLIAVAGGRYVSAEGMTRAAAAASAALARAQTASADCTAATSTADFRAGGSVTVRVSCRVELADLGLVLLPGATTITAEASSPVDTMRGTA